MKRLLTLLLICLCSLGVTAQSAKNVAVAGQFQYQTVLSDVWGYVDGHGNEYALVGKYTGFSILDVTDPVNITEKFSIPGPFSIWRDVKVWNDHAYITTEGQNGGLLIVDMSVLPADTSFDTTIYRGNNYPFGSAHNIYIDENGYAYIFGTKQQKGVIILDLNADPMAPVEVGVYEDLYLHDGYVKNDTLWASAIDDGLQLMFDVSVKPSPVLLTSFETPNKKSHNCWPSDNSDYVFTTDETQGGSIAAYDVTDFSNPGFLDLHRESTGTTPIPHNAIYKDGHLFNSYYSEGLIILDVKHPQTMVKVAHYDTSPVYTSGYNGAWGIYPFLPSGNILITDVQEGLYVLQPTLTRAAYLQGNVIDSTNQLPLSNVEVRLIGGKKFYSENSGNYFAANAQSGMYSVAFNKAGYQPDTVENVKLQNDSLTVLDLSMLPEGFTPPDTTDTSDTSGTVSVSGLQNRENANLVYPNPVQNTLHFTVQGMARVQLHGMAGRVLKKQAVMENGTLDVSDLSPGAYIIRVFNADQQMIYRGQVFKH